MPGPDDDPYIVLHEPDHAGLAVARMLARQRGMPRMVAFIEAISCAVQEIEDLLFGIIDGATLLNENSTVDALRKWGLILLEDQGSLTRGDYLTVLLARRRANVQGSPDFPNTLAGFAAFLVEIFAPASVSITVRPDNVPVVLVVVEHAGVITPDALGVRLGAMVGANRPAGLALTIQEVATGYILTDTVGRGTDGPLTSRTVWRGLPGR